MSKKPQKRNFVPLDRAELLELHRRLLKGEKTREIRLGDIYNGPSTRARLADIALQAVTDLCKLGVAKKAADNRWVVYAV
jgi:hypothetical protein